MRRETVYFICELIAVMAMAVVVTAGIYCIAMGTQEACYDMPVTDDEVNDLLDDREKRLKGKIK